MQPFTTLEALAAPLDRLNVDTDAIIPKQFLKKIERTGFGVHLFHESRYLDDAGTQPDPEFVLNLPRYKGAEILLARDNFGCGSSREHAPWSLLDFGFRCIIAPSFADIFHNNCFNNGILPVTLSPDEVQALFAEVEATEGSTLNVDLPSQSVTTGSGKVYKFEVDAEKKSRLLRGLDPIGWALEFDKRISSYEAHRGEEAPWTFPAA